MCPAFSFTDYKVQGSTLTAAILDLRISGTRRRSNHRNFCSLYVYLSRLQSSAGLYLLEKLDMDYLRLRLDNGLLEEMKRHETLQKQTIATWSQNPINWVWLVTIPYSSYFSHHYSSTRFRLPDHRFRASASGVRVTSLVFLPQMKVTQRSLVSCLCCITSCSRQPYF